VFLPTLSAIIGANFHIGETELAQAVGGGGSQFRNPFDGIHLPRQLGQHRRLIT
jgi:hypothetical protein